MRTSLKILLTLILLVSCSTLIAQDFFQTIQNGDYEKVEQYIHEEPELIDSIVKWECTPLMFASYWGKDTMVELFLKNGADMYKFRHENGRLSLHLATLQKHTDVVNVLISNGMDVNVKDGADKTALVYAIEENNKEIIELLLKHNAKLPEEKDIINQVLHSAVLYGLQNIAEELLKNGASLTGVDNNGRSLLHNAVIGANLNWIDLLIEKNLDIKKVDSFMRMPLHYSVEANQLDITKLLLKSGAKINSLDCTHRTPFSIAMGLGHIQMADLLESNGGEYSESKILKIPNKGDKASEIKIT
jgi:ankyrin repeat protein